MGHLRAGNHTMTLQWTVKLKIPLFYSKVKYGFCVNLHKCLSIFIFFKKIAKIGNQEALGMYFICSGLRASI